MWSVYGSTADKLLWLLQVQLMNDRPKRTRSVAVAVKARNGTPGRARRKCSQLAVIGLKSMPPH